MEYNKKVIETTCKMQTKNISSTDLKSQEVDIYEESSINVLPLFDSLIKEENEEAMEEGDNNDFIIPNNVLYPDSINSDFIEPDLTESHSIDSSDSIDSFCSQKNQFIKKTNYEESRFYCFSSISQCLKNNIFFNASLDTFNNLVWVKNPSMTGFEQEDNKKEEKNKARELKIIGGSEFYEENPIPGEKFYSNKKRRINNE